MIDPKRLARSAPPWGLLALLALALSASACGDDDPAWCESEGTPELSCAGPQCVLGVVVDYQRLEPRGYRVFSLDGQPVNRAEAEVIAQDHVEKTLGGETGGVADCVRDDDFHHCVVQYPSQDRYLLIVHGHTGKVLFAGYERWADPDKRGYDFPLPQDFEDATAIGCAGPAPEPLRRQLIFTNTGPLGGEQPSEAVDALRIAQKTNLAVDFLGNQSYGAIVINSSPAIGGLDPKSTDWLVWFHRIPQQ